MCNCGKKRTEFKQQQAVYSKPVNVIHQQQNVPAVLFQYTGNTALSVTGSNTRKHYRFNFPGDTQPVSLSDAAAMTAIRVLKKMS